MTTIEWDRFERGGTGFSGAVKVRTSDADTRCCGCSGGDSSLIVFYSNGAAVDLWKCQGCQCIQGPVTPVELPTGSAMLLKAGASLPEEVCSSCCYSKTLAEGAGGFAGAWEASEGIGVPALDRITLGLQLAASDRSLKIAQRQLEQCQTKAIPVEVPRPLDPIDEYLRSLAAC